MAQFDRQWCLDMVEVIKNVQGTLQHLMTLSAGGLALFFSFVGKAPFLDSVAMIGILVVICWIVSLGLAVLAHRLHGRLALFLVDLTSLHSIVPQLEEDLAILAEEAKLSIDRDAVRKRSRSAVDQARARVEEKGSRFEVSFFPMQRHAICMADGAVFFLVMGFILLGLGYALWSIVR